MSDTQVDLSSLELDGIEDIQERKALPAGQYLVRVSSADMMNSKAGNPMLRMICEFPDEHFLSPFIHQIQRNVILESIFWVYIFCRDPPPLLKKSRSILTTVK